MQKLNTNISPEARARRAWQGRVSGCMLGKPLEVLSFQQGRQGVESYLRKADAWPLRDYVPALPGSIVERTGKASCREHLVRAEPDDDINYTVLALLLMEEHGMNLQTSDVARAWLRLLPAGSTWTAERAAYQVLLCNMDSEFVNGAKAGFDLALCSENDFNEWIGAQIRTDLYGWVCPGRPELAAGLAKQDAMLSHRGEGVHGAVFIAALGAAIPVMQTLESAMDCALEHIPGESAAASAVRFGQKLHNAPFAEAMDQLQERYGHLSPVHTLNNLALLTWALCSAADDFSTAIGNVVCGGWDTDCNGATVGGLLGLAGVCMPDHWTAPWAGRIGVGLAGVGELRLDDVVARTIAVTVKLKHEKLQ